MSVYVHTTLRDRKTADACVQALLDAGFPVRGINMLQKKKDAGVERVEVHHKTRALPAAGAGAAIGAVLGAVLAAVIGEPLPLGLDLGAASDGLSTLGGALAGGAFGGLAGGIVGLGFWREKPEMPEQPEAIAVGVYTYEDRVRRASEVLREQGAGEVFASTEAAAIERLRSTHAEAA